MPVKPQGLSRKKLRLDTKLSRVGCSHRGPKRWSFTFSITPSNSRLTGRDPDAGKDGRREEKGTTEDEMVGWHHRLDRHEFEQAPGVADGQGGLACCSPWGHKESDTTCWLNNNSSNTLM